MWHPATLLLTWCGFALALQSVGLPVLSGLTLVCLALAALYAQKRCFRLLWRARWLLLSLALLFLLVTPGEYLPGVWGQLGLTYDGLLHAGEQIGRFVAMLASLALLHESVGTSGLLVGLYVLLAPFPGREMTVVRLLLVLEFVEQGRELKWRDWLAPYDEDADLPTCMRLPMPRLNWWDILIVAGLIVAILMAAILA